jgi:hypothetical protein
MALGDVSGIVRQHDGLAPVVPYPEGCEEKTAGAQKRQGEGKWSHGIDLQFWHLHGENGNAGYEKVHILRVCSGLLASECHCDATFVVPDL